VDGLPSHDDGAPGNTLVRLKLVAAASIVGAVALGPFFAGAEQDTHKDPNDTRGRLDVKRVEVAGAKRVRYKVFTFRRWKPAEVRDRGFVVVFFDTLGNSRFDYYVFARSNGNQMKGSLWRDRSRKKDYKVASLKTWRPSAQSVAIRVSIGQMKWPESRDFYSWRVQTLFSGGECRSVCFDVVPNNGRIAVPRPGATPTPTPTPTPTETPP
jgi:hypothetical protein